MYCGALNCPTRYRPWWFSQHWPKTSAVYWSCLGSLWPLLEPSEAHSSVLTVSAARPLPELGTLYEARPAGKRMFTKMCSQLDQAQNNKEGLKKKEQGKKMISAITVTVVKPILGTLCNMYLVLPQSFSRPVSSPWWAGGFCAWPLAPSHNTPVLWPAWLHIPPIAVPYPWSAPPPAPSVHRPTQRNER